MLLAGNLNAVLAAIPEHYRFSLLDINNGLSDNQIKSFLKDSRGFLWVGTSSGLNRYDGYKFKVFKYNSNDSSSLVNNDVLKLFEGPEGKIWIQTSNGACIYDPATERFSRQHEGILKKYGLPDAIVEDAVKDAAGNYWFISTGKGITRYNPADGSSARLTHAFNSKNTLSTNDVSAIRQDSEGNLWVIHRNGILDKINSQTLQVMERNDEIYKSFNQEQLNYSLTVDSDDDLWVHLQNVPGGVFFYDNKSKSLSHFHKKAAKLQLNNNMVRGVVEGAKGKIWIGTDHGGINEIDKKDFSVHYIRHNPEVEKSLSHNSINTLYKDDEGIVWIGTFKKGVNYYHPNNIRFPHIKHQSSVSTSLPYDDVNSFVEDAKGNLWIGTNGEGLLYWDRAAGTYTRYRHDVNNPNSLSSDVVVSLLIDKNNTLWVGTYLGGLNKFDGTGFTHYRNDPRDPHSLSDDSIWELYEDSKGDLWVATLRGGLELFDRQQNVFRHSRLGEGEFPVHCDYLSSIAEDSKGNLWVGGGYGIDVFNRETGKSTYFSHDPKDPHSLVSNNITYILRDSEQNIWIGTSEGLDLYNEKTNSFRHYTVADGLPSNTIVAIVEDKAKNIWLSTPSGISNMLLDRKNAMVATFRNFDELDGLQSKAFNENAAYVTSKGEIVFGGPNGLNIFLPERIGENSLSPRIVFTDFQLFNKSVEAGKAVNGRVLLPKAISETQAVSLKHDENVFSIEFAALNFFHPEKTKYRYMLEGFDKEWHTTNNTNRRVTYTNLDPGEYELKVMASNNDGIWNEEGISMQVTVLAPFWLTTEAFALYGVLAFVLLIFARKVLLQRARANFLIEQERREAHQLHELDLMKIKFLTNVSHEFKTPLTLILAPIESLLKTTKNPDQLQQFEMINRNAKRLLNLVNQLLDFRKIEVEEISLYPSEGNVVKFVEATVNSFSALSEKKNITLTFKANVPELQASFDMDKLEKILFNLLSNAFKFTPDYGFINVELNCYDNDSSSTGIKILELKVRDSGIGIAKENHKKVFERFFQDVVPGNMVNQGSGIGLSITKEFVKIHGGIITLDSAPGQGSCFTVTIPVKEIMQLHALEAEEVKEKDANASKEREAATPDKLQVSSYLDNAPVVLLVEDNEDFRFYLKDNLKEHFTIIEAKDGREGWQKALAHMPDLIVSDLMMPEVNGIDLCKKIKADSRTSHIPFVLLTAHASEDKKLDGLNIGANDYITKPFSFELLLSRIKNLITQRELLQKVFEKKISVQSSEEKVVSLDDKLVQNAIKTVEENLSNADFSVEILSKELGVSRVHLYKKLLAITGQSPVEFIRKIRLQHAAQILEKSQLTVAEVAYKVGFNNRKYFTKYFKEEYKILPSQYAESRQKETQA
ncbi:hybrid sensor histidine kinase/response regulator transcription factor [Pontibacter pamirensis]|uniref:hybrid sensor histidine kinase/response regulator transcription factor n=1 Tax=Pontibacter pamirensis TaxID=2562824 RepID=UPI001F0314D9|nr:two-component regulator propeller domain-containing protein [Pontibacter pamirensis]